MYTASKLQLPEAVNATDSHKDTTKGLLAVTV